MRKLASVLVLTGLVIAGTFALSGQVARSKIVVGPGPAPAPIRPATRVDIGAGGSMTLVCPASCPSVTSPPNHHGETQTFCDCDGDGQQDLTCKIWIKTDADGGQTAICHPGCPGTEQCAKHTVEVPDGKDYIYCACV